MYFELSVTVKHLSLEFAQHYVYIKHFYFKIRGKCRGLQTSMRRVFSNILMLVLFENTLLPIILHPLLGICELIIAFEK